MLKNNHIFNEKKTLSKRHPFYWVKNVLDKNLLMNYSIELSIYKYIRQSFLDERNIKRIESDNFTDEKILMLLNNLDDKEELAINSRVRDNKSGQTMHIPMIDFSIKDKNKNKISSLVKLSEYSKINFLIYSTGRSFHAYGDKLLTDRGWLHFMGTLLLLNQPGDVMLIDNRWVGHRIIGEYSSLRWSNNTGYYRKSPEYIGYLNDKKLETNGAPIPIDFY